MMKQELISGQASSAVLWDFKNCTIFLHWPYEPPRMAVLSSSNSLVVTPINLLLCVEYSAPSHLVFLKESIPYWVTFAVWEFISIHHPLEEREAGQCSAERNERRRPDWHLWKHSSVLLHYSRILFVNWISYLNFFWRVVSSIERGLGYKTQKGRIRKHYAKSSVKRRYWLQGDIIDGSEVSLSEKVA